MTYLDAPDTIPTRRQRDNTLDHLRTHGAACVCGREASPYQLDCLIAEWETDPEPCDFICGACVEGGDGCDDCGSGGHGPGSSVCPQEVSA